MICENAYRLFELKISVIRTNKCLYDMNNACLDLRSDLMDLLVEQLTLMDRIKRTKFAPLKFALTGNEVVHNNSKYNDTGNQRIKLS